MKMKKKLNVFYIMSCAISNDWHYGSWSQEKNASSHSYVHMKKLDGGYYNRAAFFKLFLF